MKRKRKIKTRCAGNMVMPLSSENFSYRKALTMIKFRQG
jgi:hypothetical protein